MATHPDEARRQQEEAAVAALLLLGASYSLPQIIRTAQVTSRPFRRIEPTEALRASIARPYFDLVRAWRDEREAILNAYSLALPVRGGPVSPEAAAQLRSEIDAAAARVERKMAVLERQFPGQFRRLAEWHRLQWIQRIKGAAGVDVVHLSQPNATTGEVESATARTQQLLSAVHDETKGKIGIALLAALAATTPRAAVSSLLSSTLDKAKARGARIAVDQTDMAGEAFSRVRRREAGLARFRWHHTRQEHPRPEHKARDNRVYSHSNAPNDRAGTLPFCKCWEEPLFD